MNNDILDREDSEVPLCRPDLTIVREMVKEIIKQQGGKARMTSWDKGKFCFHKCVLTWKWSE